MARTAEKARENRLRDVARRRGLALHKSARRDPAALDYACYVLTDAAGRTVFGGSGYLDRRRLDDVETWLNGAPS